MASLLPLPADDELVAVSELRDCYVKLGWFKRAPLFWTHYKSGREDIVYRVGPVFDTIVSSRPDLLRRPSEVERG